MDRRLRAAALVAIDYVTTGGFYTAKFTEMTGKIVASFSHR